ncbi:hypothetical protein C5167_037106 [Papaver somniferum]|uniref:F-box associated beta-propeller type 3 domain-containing protein n=1 Tax=Papaver somniferum TaxID=3469 RepID=A0A4Y7I805_PAPSO|nr:hypothetical protein C5167_037106 [Papaver somniferum]
MHARNSGTHGFGFMYLSLSYTDDDDDDDEVVREIDGANGVMKSDAHRMSGFHLHLAYDAAAEKYKVVCFYKRKRQYIFKIVTVDVKSDSWRNVLALSSPCLLDDYEAVFANGFLNWLTHDRYPMSGCKVDQGKILSLDVSKEKFYTLDYPNGVSDENGENQRKQNQHNEWLEYNIEVLQNNDVPKLFHNFESNKCVGIIKNPTLKIIFWNTNVRILDEPDERGFISFYTPEDYSYDVELKTFDFISQHRWIFVKWDLNSLVHFQSTFADVKSDSWRNVVDLSSPCLLDDYEAVFANGSLNWLTHDRYDMGGCKADQGKTLSLDVSEEKFYKIDYPKGENEEKQRKRDQRNEWLECNVDILQNNDVSKLFHNLDNFHCVAVVKNPELKIIFWTTNRRILDKPDERGFSRFYTTEFYSYDVDLKTFALISKHTGIFVKWDLNSLVHFNQPLLGPPQRI